MKYTTILLLSIAFIISLIINGCIAQTSGSSTSGTDSTSTSGGATTNTTSTGASTTATTTSTSGGSGVPLEDIKCLYDNGKLFGFCVPILSSSPYYSFEKMVEGQLQIPAGFNDTLTVHMSPNGTKCYEPDGSIFLDAFIRDAIYSLQENENLYTNLTAPKETIKVGATKCVEFLAMRACTVIFRSPYPDPLEGCSAFCPTIYKTGCPYAQYPLEYRGYQLYPQNETACMQGLSNDTASKTCTVFNMINRVSDFTYNPDIPSPEGPEDKVLEGTLLAFGMLIAFLLIIASLGFIMNRQQKK